MYIYWTRLIQVMFASIIYICCVILAVIWYLHINLLESQVCNSNWGLMVANWVATPYGCLYHSVLSLWLVQRKNSVPVYLPQSANLLVAMEYLIKVHCMHDNAAHHCGGGVIRVGAVCVMPTICRCPIPTPKNKACMGHANITTGYRL